MYELKTLSEEGIPSALKKAERYRLLNEPDEAESICLDILQVAPNNQEALISLLLARTDKFKKELGPAFNQAKGVLERLNSDHCRFYYRGIIYERRARAHMDHAGPGSEEMAYDWFTKAMADYECALESCARDNQDAALRWNTCARILNANPNFKPNEPDPEVQIMDGWE